MATVHDEKYYSIPKGKVLFREDAQASWEDLGNCSKLEITEEIESVEHFSSRAGLKVRDQLVITSIKASGALSLDSVHRDNLHKYFMADSDEDTTTTQTLATDTTVTVAGVNLDRWHEIGKINLTNVVVKDSTEVTTYVLGTDYVLDTKAGLIMPLSTGSISEDDDIKVTYDNPAATIYHFLAASALTLRGHLYFVSDPGVGEIDDLKGYGSITPDGTYNAISDEFVVIGLKCEFITHDDYSPGLMKVSYRGNVSAAS